MKVYVASRYDSSTGSTSYEVDGDELHALIGVFSRPSLAKLAVEADYEMLLMDAELPDRLLKWTKTLIGERMLECEELECRWIVSEQEVIQHLPMPV